MPRRTDRQARRAALKEMGARIRLLIRNPQFRIDLMELRKLDDPYGWKHTHTPPGLIEEAVKAAKEFDPSKLGALHVKFPDSSSEPISSYWGFLKKWGLEWFPNKLVEGTDPLPAAGEVEKIIAEELNEARTDPNFRLIQRPAVIASEPFNQWYEEQAEEWDGTDQVVEVPSHIPGPGTVLNIQVDLSYPQDVIEAEIKKEVRQAKARRQALEQRGLLPARPERLRLDRVAFHLKVYDLAKQGKTFNEIRVVTNRPVSTVKSALLAASKKIASLVIPALSPPSVSKESLPLADFDPDNHVSRCPQCKSADRPENMCDLAKRFMNQDYVSQRELPGVDTVHDVPDPDAAA